MFAVSKYALTLQALYAHNYNTYYDGQHYNQPYQLSDYKLQRVDIHDFTRGHTCAEYTANQNNRRKRHI